MLRIFFQNIRWPTPFVEDNPLGKIEWQKLIGYGKKRLVMIHYKEKKMKTSLGVKPHFNRANPLQSYEFILIPKYRNTETDGS